MQKASSAFNTVEKSQNSTQYSVKDNKNQNSTYTTVSEVEKQTSHNLNTENTSNQSIVATIVNALIVGLLLAAGGAIAAWALTSISPISGAIMSGTFVATFILTLDLLPEEYKGLSFVAAAIATNLVVYGAFPYLGLEAISWVTVTTFSTVTTMAAAFLAKAFQPEKKLEVDFSYLHEKHTTTYEQHPDAFDNLVNAFM